jgi:phosphatidate cytidylyltransferase
MPEDYYLVVIVMTLILILSPYVFSYPKYHAEQVIATFLGMVYVAVMLGFIYVIRSSESGKILVWLVFLSSWGSDTCAYCAGVLLGRHKMAPILSPKKSVEGAVGGVVGAGLLGLLYAFIFHQPMAAYAIICAAGALISMVGDLAASAIKRDKGIKDYGKLIPGHGGVLDRFDSVIFTAPIIYFLSLVLI